MRNLFRLNINLTMVLPIALALVSVSPSKYALSSSMVQSSLSGESKAGVDIKVEANKAVAIKEKLEVPDTDPFQTPESLFEKSRKVLKVATLQTQNFSCRAICILTAEVQHKDKPLYILHTEVMIEAGSPELGLAALRSECNSDDEKLVHSFVKDVIKDEVAAASNNYKKGTKGSKNIISKNNNVEGHSIGGEEYVISSSEVNSENSCIPTHLSSQSETDLNDESKMNDSKTLGTSVLEAE